ncbi:zeta toxin family protein [soil metagenome]
MIAQGLSAFSSESVSFEAGKLMLQRLRDLANGRKSFSFETTLATRFYANWISGLKRKGFEFHLVFLWLESPELACERVQNRVTRGGHNIPKNIIYRRYFKGLRNFFKLYQPIADSWAFYDNSKFGNPDIIAEGGQTSETIFNKEIWREICKLAESK